MSGDKDKKPQPSTPKPVKAPPNVNTNTGKEFKGNDQLPRETKDKK